VDRSGSVERAGTAGTIRRALTDFVLNDGPNGAPALVEGRDMIGIGSFGGSWKLDLSPTSRFRTGRPSAAKTIEEMPFGEGVTNTAEGLYQAYVLLWSIADPGALNIIVLLTDGRPNAFTAIFDVAGWCGGGSPKKGYITALIGPSWPPLPPETPGERGIYTLGLYKPEWTAAGDMTLVENRDGCRFSESSRLFSSDASIFPERDAYGNSTAGPVYPLQSISTSNPRAVRYAAINAADNMAARIRKDSAIHPILIVIGLNEPPQAGEPLDAGWLAAIANDPTHRDARGVITIQAGQTSGKYYNTVPATLASAFQDLAVQVGNWKAR
jgi:hypothetical protein